MTVISREIQISSLVNHKMREAIGAICVHWSLLELMVERVIANLNGSPGAVTYIADLAHRLEDLKAAAKTLPPDRRERISEIAGFIKKVKEERHRAAHGLWGLREDGSFVSLFPRDASGHVERPMDTQTLREIKLRIWEAHQALRPFAGLGQSAALSSPDRPVRQAFHRPALRPDPQATK